jgi:hypothetical protein
MRCILDAERISRILYQSMLKATSSANERPILRASESDGPECPAYALVRTAWTTPQSITLFQRSRARSLVQQRRRQPRAIHTRRQEPGRVAQGLVGGNVGRAAGIKVPYDADPEQVVHPSRLPSSIGKSYDKDCHG